MSLFEPRGSDRRGLREGAVAGARRVAERLRRSPLTEPIVVAVSRNLFRSELRRLHDTLATTPMSERYWMFGGVLLGWAREGDILAHDTTDVDFAFLESDYEAMASCVDLLGRAGFRLFRAYRNNDGTMTQFVFERSGIHFDFFCVAPVEDRLRYYGYFRGVQIIAEIPAQPLEHFDLAGRSWLKAKDHDRDLSALYGDWRTPQKDWRTDRDSPAVLDRVEWKPPAADPANRSRSL